MSEEIYDGRWKVVDKKPKNKGFVYTLENIFNKKQITMWHTTFYNIKNGKTTVSDVVSHRLGNRHVSKYRKKANLRW